MLHQLVAMPRAKILSADFAVSTGSDPVKETELAAAQIAMKIAKQPQPQLNRHRRNRQRGLQPLLSQLNRPQLSILLQANLIQQTAAVEDLADQSAAVPTVQT